MVLRVDKEKGYIDLSKRRVSPEDLALCEDKYNKSKMIHSIMRHVAETTGNDVHDLYQNIGWPLYKMYGHAFEAFKVRLDVAHSREGILGLFGMVSVFPVSLPNPKLCGGLSVAF